MATLRNVEKLSKKLCVRNTPLIYFTRNLKTILKTPYEILVRKDLLPSQVKYLPNLCIPKTKEEFEAAAARYGLHPYEYKPYPDDHRYTGDYPDSLVPSIETKCPYYPWDFYPLKRNFNEFMKKAYNVPKMVDNDFKPYGYSLSQARVLWYSSVAAVLILYYVMIETSQPVMEKQYLLKGEHYTFELK
ncbi:PREDICTED: NADH dehydrogenase [ubiquinone] 1 beta subcomplex subunit 8, mitochondrial [Eufriesea mexicana]|uniref:NADH dehydrogenase [ubiquinone] 1 beta subcomplex subunit 8, mitochondrial n=1 Tax=Eufriesea mexicana TaxID=516756 RepID=UPI00083BB21A|nr:PREDICTED: NADH dehydrogenase [ubiquinone] 1 beta subcomplex subunit 8, mitochondrial [Eufriesea mexicana]